MPPLSPDQLQAIKHDITEAVIEGLAKGTKNNNKGWGLSIAAIAVALLIPISGWVMSLQSRVSVLESQQTSLQTAAVEIGQLKQEITDFRTEWHDWKRTQERNQEAVSTAQQTAAALRKK